MEKLINTKELAERLGVSPYTIIGWVHRKTVPYIKVGKCTRFKESQIERWMLKRTKESQEVEFENI